MPEPEKSGNGKPKFGQLVSSIISWRWLPSLHQIRDRLQLLNFRVRLKPENGQHCQQEAITHGVANLITHARKEGMFVPPSFIVAE